MVLEVGDITGVRPLGLVQPDLSVYVRSKIAAGAFAAEKTAAFTLGAVPVRACETAVDRKLDHFSAEPTLEPHADIVYPVSASLVSEPDIIHVYCIFIVFNHFIYIGNISLFIRPIIKHLF